MNKPPIHYFHYFLILTLIMAPLQPLLASTLHTCGEHFTFEAKVQLKKPSTDNHHHQTINRRSTMHTQQSADNVQYLDLQFADISIENHCYDNDCSCSQCTATIIGISDSISLTLSFDMSKILSFTAYSINTYYHYRPPRNSTSI